MSGYVTCPGPEADLKVILRFALSYNGYERIGRGVEDLARVVKPVLEHLKSSGSAPPWAGTDLLRAALFFLQRQSHHWGHVPPDQEQRMRVLVDALRRAEPGLMLNDYQPAGLPAGEMTWRQVLTAARALCPDSFGGADALHDLVSLIGWSSESLPGRVMTYEVARLSGAGVEHDPTLVELRRTLGAEPTRHRSWRIRRYATLGALLAAAVQSVHLGEDLDEVRQLLLSSVAGAWPVGGTTG
jgi:hypothetical protein